MKVLPNRIPRFPTPGVSVPSKTLDDYRPYQTRDRFNPTWMKKQVIANASELKERIKGDPNIKRLHRILATPYRERQQRLQALLTGDRMEKLMARYEELHGEMYPLIKKLQDFDLELDKIIERIYFLHWRYAHTFPPSDLQLKQQIKVEIRRITQDFAHDLWVRSREKIRKIHMYRGTGVGSEDKYGLEDPRGRKKKR